MRWKLPGQKPSLNEKREGLLILTGRAMKREEQPSLSSAIYRGNKLPLSNGTRCLKGVLEVVRLPAGLGKVKT